MRKSEIVTRLVTVGGMLLTGCKAIEARPVATPGTAKEMATRCLTTEEVKALVGVDVQKLESEPCAWVRRSKPNYEKAKCPEGFVCTWDVQNDVTVVHNGIDQEAMVGAGTWRYTLGYPEDDDVNDVCRLFEKEKAFGEGEKPPFEVRYQKAKGDDPKVCH